MSEIYWHLRSNSFFDSLPDEPLTALSRRTTLRTVEAGTPIFLAGSPRDSVFLLLTGRVRLHHITPGGKEVLLGIVDRGELFAEVALIATGEREHCAAAMEPSNVLAIPTAELRPLLREHLQLCLRTVELVTQRRLECERRLTSLLFRSVRERLVSLLVDLAEKYGEHSADGVRIGIPLSQQDLSSAIGSTRETVSLTLGELQAQGHLRVERRQITLLNSEALVAAVGRSAPHPAEE